MLMDVTLCCRYITHCLTTPGSEHKSHTGLPSKNQTMLSTPVQQLCWFLYMHKSIIASAESGYNSSLCRILG